IEGYMKYMPWVYIIFGCLGIFFLVIGLVLGAAVAPFLVVFGGAAGVGFSGALFGALIIGLITNVLEVVGGYLMRQRKLTGWWAARTCRRLNRGVGPARGAGRLGPRGRRPAHRRAPRARFGQAVARCLESGSHRPRQSRRPPPDRPRSRPHPVRVRARCAEAT